jgi:hypothetical protein
MELHGEMRHPPHHTSSNGAWIEPSPHGFCGAHVLLMGTHTPKVTNNISRSNGLHCKLLDERCLKGLEIIPTYLCTSETAGWPYILTGWIFLLVGMNKHTIELYHLIQDSVKWKGRQRAKEFAFLWTPFWSSSRRTVITIVPRTILSSPCALSLLRWRISRERAVIY